MFTKYFYEVVIFIDFGLPDNLSGDLCPNAYSKIQRKTSWETILFFFTLSVLWVLLIISCMTSWHKRYFSLGFFADTDEWDHLCKNVSWAEIQSGGRISETGVGSFPIQVWSARGMAVRGRGRDTGSHSVRRGQWFLTWLHMLVTLGALEK